MIHNEEYEEAWKDGEEPAPLSDAVAKAGKDKRAEMEGEYAKAHRDLDEKEASDGDETPDEDEDEVNVADAVAEEEPAKKGQTA